MQSVDFYKKLIKERLSEGRYIHSLNVADSAVMLCGLYNADESKAYLAGILHDITKEESLETQYELIQRNGERLTTIEISNPNVLHQMSGAAYCRLELDIEDEDILGAVRYHTTGRADMTLLEKIVYTADFISADRNYPDVEAMRSLALKSLDDAMLYSLKYTITKLTSKTKLIHPDTFGCYNSVLENKIKD